MLYIRQVKHNLLIAMADRGHQHCNHPPVVSATPPAPPVQLPAQQYQLVPPMLPEQPVQPVLNWAHFEKEFSGKPEGDAGAHLLRTND